MNAFGAADIVDVVMVGASGYGAFYINMFLNMFRDGAGKGARICAVVDPFAASSPHLDWIERNWIPMYDSLEDFYGAGGHADLVVISSPIQFHWQQSKVAMEHGAAVLCEKPLCANAADAESLYEIWRKHGVPFGVGFQWSFSPTMVALKRDIMDGVFGKPLFLKTLVSWPRDDKYYDPRGWKGKRKDKDGSAVNDSIAMNATAHYLHNMLFILGETADRSACPASVSGSMYRARDIETFDTCFLRGTLANGCGLLYCVSHVAERLINPIFEYRFEKGTVTFREDTDGVARAVFADGRVKEYGRPLSDAEVRVKLAVMIEAARTGAQPDCGIRAIMPHLMVCDAMLADMEIQPFPPELIVTTTEPTSLYVKGLDDVMVKFYETEQYPDAGAVDWMAPERQASLRQP